MALHLCAYDMTNPVLSVVGRKVSGFIRCLYNEIHEYIAQLSKGIPRHK